MISKSRMIRGGGGHGRYCLVMLMGGSLVSENKNSDSYLSQVFLADPGTVDTCFVFGNILLPTLCFFCNIKITQNKMNGVPLMHGQFYQ